ncbi:MAG: hypothetical protein Kow002_21810 [Anaerolineales bacterium]
MNASTDPTQPGTPQPRRNARARRRRARRTFFPKDAEGRAVVLTKLTRRAYPSYELFIFSLLCGAVLGVGYVFDAHALLIFGILFAPLMTPWVGLALSIISGIPRMFIQTLAGLLISAVFVFGTGALAGLASQPFQPLTFTQAFLHSRLWIPDLVVLALGSILLTASFARSEDKPYLPSVMIAYELFLPLSAAGLGLGSGVPDLWPNGLLVFFAHLVWATVFGLLTLAVLRFRPLTAGGYAFSAVIFISLLAAIFQFAFSTSNSIPTVSMPTDSPTASASALSAVTQESLPTLIGTSTPLPTSTRSLPPTNQANSLTQTVTPVALTLEVTLPPTATLTPVPSIEPTPVYAIIRSREGGGAFMRDKPRGSVILTLDNGSVVQVLPDTQENSGVTWLHIKVRRNDFTYEGWIIQSVVEMATPVPAWEPSPTPAPTETATAINTP